MSIDISDFISDDIGTIPATRFIKSGSRDAQGRWVENADIIDTHEVILQPVTGKELANIGAGGERIQDFRKIYIPISPDTIGYVDYTDEWEFDVADLTGVRFISFNIDNRLNSNYCKCVVARRDR